MTSIHNISFQVNIPLVLAETLRLLFWFFCQVQFIQIKMRLPCLFKGYKAIILGDREFCSVKLANWLREEGLLFCLRLKKTEFIEKEDGVWEELNDLGLRPGISLFIEGIKVTKTQKMGGFNLAGKWKRNHRGIVPKEGWFILTNLQNLAQAIAAYKKRFCIEEMFRYFKSDGYNLENTNVSGERLISLILLIAIS